MSVEASFHPDSLATLKAMIKTALRETLDEIEAEAKAKADAETARFDEGFERPEHPVTKLNRTLKTLSETSGDPDPKLLDDFAGLELRHRQGIKAQLLSQSGYRNPDVVPKLEAHERRVREDYLKSIGEAPIPTRYVPLNMSLTEEGDPSP